MKVLKMCTRKEIQRLRKLGHSKNKIAKKLDLDWRTIQRYWDSPSPESPRETPSWIDTVDWEHVKTRRKDGMFATDIYRELSPAPSCSYGTFARRLAKIEKEEAPVKIIPPRIKIPGEEIEVDYSGDSIPFVLPATGEKIKTELFLGVLPYSQKFYAEFSLSQTLKSCIMSVVNMLHFFDGVPKFLVVDNMKTAVNKYHKYDPCLNRSFQDMARYYGTGVSPARPYRPKDKPSVENAVGIIQQHFFPLVKRREFHSLGELNRELFVFLKKYHALPLQRKGVSRDEFFEKEKAALGPLPKTRYEFCDWKKVKVHPDCHFQHGKNYYSVPYVRVGDALDVKFNEKTVTAYFEGEHVATHAVALGNGHYVSNSAHFPESKRLEDFRNLGWLLERAGRIGENCLLAVERISERGVHPLANYKRMLGIVELGKKYSKEAMEYACETALEMNRLNYHYVKNCANSYHPPSNEHTKAPIREAGTTFLQGEFEDDRSQETTGDA